MKLQEKPTDVAQRQALAAIGQVHLMRYYEDFFSAMNIVSESVSPDQVQMQTIVP
jgi:glutamate 5-kinase